MLAQCWTRGSRTPLPSFLYKKDRSAAPDRAVLYKRDRSEAPDGAVLYKRPEKDLPRRVPVVEAVQPPWIGPDRPGEELDGVDIVEVQVVVEDRRPHVVRRPVMDQVAGGGHDRVMRIPDVAALAPVGPGAGKELHRPLRAG